MLRPAWVSSTCSWRGVQEEALSAFPLPHAALPSPPHTQPLHFGAASGMGLCHLQLGEQEEALAAFEMALRIHPGLEDIRRIAGDLRAQQQQQQQ